jgi:U3 small nucleolar RNA-associated protein 23
MRGKRSKQYRKLMHQYGLAFDFREPYQVLLSSEIIKDAARCKMRLGQMLEGTLHGQIKPMITQCCIRYLYNAQDGSNQEEKDGWIAVAKDAERRRCGHHELEEPMSELDCLRSVVDPKDSGTNKHRYVIATQDVEVRKWMRANVAGVPMIYISRSVMILEPMSGRTEDVKNAEEKRKYRAGLRDTRAKSAGAKRKREEEEEDDDDNDDDNDEDVGEQNGEIQNGETAKALPPKKRKIKGPKGPNPLSVKKAKKEKKEKHGRPKIPVKHWKPQIPTNGDSSQPKVRGKESKYKGEAEKRKRKRAAKASGADTDQTNGGGQDA